MTKLLFFLYLDPGSGSLIIQAIIAGIAGSAYAVKIYYHKIKSFLGIKSHDE
jgi:hypothetical protein